MFSLNVLGPMPIPYCRQRFMAFFMDYKGVMINLVSNFKRHWSVAFYRVIKKRHLFGMPPCGFSLQYTFLFPESESRRRFQGSAMHAIDRKPPIGLFW
jgi:hypothetical protein